ncbi:uncharacterized protein CBL_05661 [Carabus blaptoides fortunei]
MAEAQSTGRDTLPKMGRVNEVCREWLIREDGALAYRLQNEEITEHYTGNKYRNAQVREDFPCALDEQIREQRLAEQAAALYHQMITEQEEQDAEVAKQLANKIEREELAKKRALEAEDEEIAKQILEREHVKQLDKQQRLLAQQSLQTQPATCSSQQQHMEQHSPLTQSPRKPEHHDSPRKGESHDMCRRSEYHESPKRQGYLMPLPNRHTPQQQQLQQPGAHYRSSSDDLLDPFQQCSIADALELGLPVDAVDEKRMQEERDAELARKLQEQESCSAEELQLNRDRMLAIEAQDKELAKLLQERERAKVRRAKERAKQKALAKKQQELNPDQILPDDSYSNPIDLLQHPECSHTQSYRLSPQDCHAHDDDVNYSLPVDMVSGKAAYDHNLKQNYSPQKNYESRLNGYSHKSEIRAMNGGYVPGGSGVSQERESLAPAAVRPTQLDLKSPITKSMKARPDPDTIEVCESLQPDNNYPLHNIAMAIDPTYTRRTLSSHTPSSQDTSTISTSTTSSTTSPAISLPPPDLSEDELSPVPPYMPIQGQRRTASLEKKKKRAKDGCKQQ